MDVLYITLLLSLLGTAVCRPHIVTPHGNFSTDPISAEDREYLYHHARTHRASYPPGFKFMWIAQDGHIAKGQAKPAGNYIRLVGSPQSPENVMYIAAMEMYKMMRHSDSQVFNRIANSEGGVGIFTPAETLTVYPEFSNSDIPGCGDRCDGVCSSACTTDGRPYKSLAGVTSTLSLVITNNIMCEHDEPYHHRDNVLIHEFAHSVDRFGFSQAQHTANTAAYNNAKARHLWLLGVYSMSNTAEYFAEATGAYFLVNMQTMGMTDCSYGECRTEQDARNFLQQRDSLLYNLLSSVYGAQPSHLKTCYIEQRR